MIKPDISVIILTWNAVHHLERFLPSVAAHTPEYAEIIIADNASTDRTAEFVKETYPHFRHLLLDENYGYCKGNNMAVEAALGEFVVILNNDVGVTKGWLEPILQMLRIEKQTAVVQPRLRSVEEPEYFEYGGAAGGLIDIFGYPFCRGRVFDSLEKDNEQYSTTTDIFWASGAAFAVSRDLYLEFGGFEEAFEFHMEEIDLCWRFLNSGYRIRYCPHSIVYHLGGGSLPTGSYRKVFFNYRNNLAMMWRNLTLGGLIARFPIRLLLDYVSAVRSLMSGNFIIARAVIHSHLAFIRWLPALQRQRRNLQKRRKVRNDPATVWRGSVVWKYFIQGRKHYSDF